MPMLTPPVNNNDHVLGPHKALVTLVEFGDFECPYCGMAYPIVKDVIKEFGNDLRFAFRHFPLSEIHPHAEKAAEAAEAAAAQVKSKFWPMHDMLYENQDALDDMALLQYVEALDLDMEIFATALEQGTYRPKVEGHFMCGVYSGVNGTPTFFINGRRHQGSYDFETLSQAIRHAKKETTHV